MADEQTNEAPEVSTAVSAQDGLASVSERLIPFAQLGLRLLGVMFVIDGGAAIGGAVVHVIAHWRLYMYSLDSVVSDPQTIAWVTSGLVQFFLGFYLVVDGRWVLRNVFLPAPGLPHADRRDGGE